MLEFLNYLEVCLHNSNNTINNNKITVNNTIMWQYKENNLFQFLQKLYNILVCK